MPTHTVAERQKNKTRNNPVVRKPIKRGKPVKTPSIEKILKAKRKSIPKKRRKK